MTTRAWEDPRGLVGTAGANSPSGDLQQRIDRENALLVKKQDLARAVSVSCRCIDNWMRSKRIPYIRLSARCVRFHLPSVLAALRRFEIKEIGYPRNASVGGLM